MLALPGVLCAEPPAPSATADLDSLIAAADGDTLGVLLDVIEDLELDLALADVKAGGIAWERDRLQAEIDAARPSWFEVVVRDPRLWFIVGAFTGALAVRQ